MKVLRMGVCCAMIGWLAADANAQSGAYGAPNPISWSQDNLPAGNAPTNTIPTAYVAADDGSASTQNVPAHDTSSLAPMLSEPGTPVAPATGANSTSVMPEGGYMKDAGNPESSDCCCGYTGCCCSPWYFSADFLYMTRSAPNKVYTSAEQSALVNQGYFNEVGWTWGAEATVGYRFGCCCDWSLEATYWGLAESDTDGGPGIPGPYVSPMTFGLTNILGTTGGGGTGGDQTANNYTDNSPDHHIWREWDVQNIEVNLVKNICGGCNTPASVDFLVGFRWFRFQDGFVFGAERANDGTAYANDWLYLNDHINNDMLGLQAGFNASYRFWDCWKAFIRPEFGIYNNHMTLDYNLYAVSSTTGQQYQASSSTYANPNYPVHASANGFSFLTQVDVGLEWQLTRHFSVNGGYRVVAATGVGLADNQIPFFGNDTQAIADIDRNGSLIVDGAFAGCTFVW